MAVRNRRNSVTCAGVMLPALLMECGEAPFEQPQWSLSNNSVVTHKSYDHLGLTPLMATTD